MAVGKADFKKELDALGTVLQAVGSLDPAGQTFVMRLAIERLAIAGVATPGGATTGASAQLSGGAGPSTTQPRDAKAFLKDKKPINEVQRVVVLAYFLDRYKGTPEFKTPDLVALNQEAGGLKIGNPTRAVDNATRRSNYLVSVKGGNKKISAHGEDVVDALPDQAKVTEVETAFAAGARRIGRRRGAKKAKG